jgi:hypothetical protein
MPIIQVNNIFTPEELELIKNTIFAGEIDIDETLGRRHFKASVMYALTDEMAEKLYAISKQASDLPLAMGHAQVTEYSAEYGQPNLPPHFDGDTHDLIINMQLESNTSWDIGLNTEVYSLEDNSAVVFNGNTETHWRPRKEFKEGEYVRMMFVRFYNEEKLSDYSYLPMHPMDPVFADSHKVRDSII